MKSFKIIVLIISLGFCSTINAQDTTFSEETTDDKMSYYKKRAIEDAKYEQQFNVENKAEEEAFWADQKTYEKELKRKDRKAYKAYMRRKRDAYAEHYDHCDSHCYHSTYYYHQATFYYRYNRYYFDKYPNSGGGNTRVQIGTPSVRLGLF